MTHECNATHGCNGDDGLRREASRGRRRGTGASSAWAAVLCAAFLVPAAPVRADEPATESADRAERADDADGSSRTGDTARTERGGDAEERRERSGTATRSRDAARSGRSGSAVGRSAASTAQGEELSAEERLRRDVARRLRVRSPRTLREAMRTLSARRIDVDWKDMPLRDAVDWLGRVAGFNVLVGPELQKDGLDEVPKITLRLKDVTLAQLARLMARMTGTHLAVESRMLHFTTAEAARGKPTLRIYSIGELTAEIRNFPGPDIQLRPSGAEFEPEEQSVVESDLADPDRIAEMLQEHVESKTWSDEGVSIDAHKNRLVIRQYPHVHRKIGRFLAMLRAAR